MESLQQRAPQLAIRYFRDADKQDQGHCLPCQQKLVQLGLATQDWKALEDGASEMATEVTDPEQQAVAHDYIGLALMNRGAADHQNDLLARAHDEFTKAIAIDTRLTNPLFDDGRTLAQLHRDAEAKAQFEKFISKAPPGSFERMRAEQFVSKPELARANLIPDFTLVTPDGERLTASSLVGKVALVYFWASYCQTCVRDLPRLKKIAGEFNGQPFVLLTVSVDYDSAAWYVFREKNEIPGVQYRDGFNGMLAQVFGVSVHFESEVQNPVGGTWQTSKGLKQDVPKTFTIDADGVVTQEKLSDSLEGNLKALIARAGQNQAGN